uniref:E3 ubiquitin-protein ligase n=1 Tax=Globisporangium ultimum (strain ATCC 200006 / CBS 805.95 / DAOM BR144) TaxID=431595 RepID=K3WDX6_GLOUD
MASGGGDVALFRALEEPKADAAAASAALVGDAAASGAREDDSTELAEGAAERSAGDAELQKQQQQRATEQKKNEARILSQLLLLFCVKRSDTPSGKPPAFNVSYVVEGEERDGHKENDEEAATSRELALVREFLNASKASQNKIAQSLFVLQPSLIDSFAPILEFFIRIIIVAHADSHAGPTEILQTHHTDAHENATTRIQSPRYCTWTHNGHVNCVKMEKHDSNASDTADTTSETTTFHFPVDFHACLVSKYGSVKRSKCEEVWHGDHMAYRCRTCGLSDSSCMCLGCFNPDDHEGHDYRVYRCSSGGCCDCGDPLAWRPEGFCKKHSAAVSESAKSLLDMPIGELEDDVVKLLVRRTVGFCVNVLREVYLFCLRPGGAYDSDPFYPMRGLPKTGRRRNSFPDIIQVYLERVQQALAWLQMLATSCVRYRDIVSLIFFEPLPADFQLDPPIPAHHYHGHATMDESQIHKGNDHRQQSNDAHELDGSAAVHEPSNLLILDVFLKAGVLLPVETCDALGVLYLKLLFDHPFKQKYTCHFVEWYPYYIDLFLKASEENNEDGMRNLSRFIDRLFCQLFHSTAQLQELESLFSTTHIQSMYRQRRPRLSPVSSHTSCVEWLMLFLLEKLNGLFKSALRVETIEVKRRRKDHSSAEDSESTVLQYVVDCGRNVFKKRIYARLCSDLRTLLVHPQIAAHAILHSFHNTDGAMILSEKSVYWELVQAFKLLQQMDLQQRHIHQHIEYESQNWTFAFVVDYEVNLLLNAFLSGIPYCFSTSELLESSPIALPAPFNPRETLTFDRIALARALLEPVQKTVLSWTHRSGCPEWSADGECTGSTHVEKMDDLLEYYEGNPSSLEVPMKKSFHLPLHHMLASLVHSLSVVIQPRNETEWKQLFNLKSVEQDSRHEEPIDNELEFALTLSEYPLRVCFFTREVKAGLWVRNGNSMWQQLIHYYSKHWRFYGVHSDLYLCQLSALIAPRGTFTRFFLHQFPFGLHESSVFRVTRGGDLPESDDNADESKQAQEVRHEIELTEEMFRLLLQILLSPVKMATSAASVESATWLLEREMMHWLSLGPFTRSEVIMRTDMKLVEQFKQLPGHPWSQLEEEEILTQVLESVGVYEDASTTGSALSSGTNILGFGLKMSGSWKLKPDLWSKISPFFECFTPSEAQQCEQNIRNRSPSVQNSASDLPTQVIPVLPDLPGAALQMHAILADKLFNAPYLVGALFIILLKWKQQNDTNHKPSNGVVSENLLLAALQCVYIGMTLLQDHESREANDKGIDGPVSQSGVDAVPAVDIGIKDVVSSFGEEVSFSTNLCTSVHTGESTSASLLSLLMELASEETSQKEVKAIAQQTLRLAEEKSPRCRSTLARERARIASQTRNSVGAAGTGAGNGTSSNDERTRQAKEMMRQRQQMILEKMRSKQMQFLSSHGEAKPEGNSSDEASKSVSGGNVSDDTESDAIGDDGFDDDEEEDEWGFPTGQIDVHLYLDHVSSAIALACDKEKNIYDRRQKLRRSSRSSSTSSMSGRTSDQHSERFSCDEGKEEAEECGLCRMPCEASSSSPSSFGFIGMILPTSAPQKLREAHRMSTPAFPSVRLTKVNASGEPVSIQLPDATIWSCGHPVHHECLKSYLSTLWGNKNNRSPTEMLNGEDRLLSERDMEFQCPVCRRLSNCLVPSVSQGHLQRDQKRSSFYRSLRGFDDCEEEESKDEDLQDSLLFVKWINSQMSFCDDSPVVKRRKSRSLSYLRSRLSSSSSERKRANTTERHVDRFYNEITLRSLRAAMQLPLLMSGEIEDESQVQTEIEDAANILGVVLPAWQIFVRSLEIQVDLVEEEKLLLGIKSVDKQRMQSMRYLADVAVSASAISAQNSLSWTVIDVPHESKFDVVMSKLNGILFGHQVLFEEDETVNKAAKSSEFLLALPVLCHPDLFSFFITRVLWRQGLQTSSTTLPNVAVIELASEVFFLARVVVTARVLQSLCCIRLQTDYTDESAAEDDPVDETQGAGDGFDRVQSIKDAYRWVSQLLAHCKLVDHRNPSSNVKQKQWNASDVEEEMSAMCLPLVKRMLLLMEVVLPSSCAKPDATELDEDMCAVCDGLFHHSLTAQPESEFTGSKSYELEKYLRRLHLPPLRLFFHLQTFSQDQRGLCELWGAQLQAKAAVLRQQQIQQCYDEAESIARPHDGNLFSSLMHLNETMASKSPQRLIISLPRIYMNLFMMYNDKPRGICQQCNQLPQHPAICLFCGVVLCCFSPCCESARGNIGECSQHAQTCGLGFGAFLLLRACTVILFLGNERRCVWGSVYVDKNGEEDPYLRRGKTLYLDESRLLALETLLLSHGFAQNTAILANTSRRDGRRY